MRSKIILIASSVLLILVGLFLWSLSTGPSDQVLIAEAIDSSVKASREGKAGGVLEYLSKDLTVPGAEEIDNQAIKNFISKQKPDIDLENKNPIISGDKAVVTTDVTVSFGAFGMKVPTKINAVQIELRKETGFKYLVFPTKKWRIVRIFSSDDASRNLLTQ